MTSVAVPQRFFVERWMRKVNLSTISSQRCSRIEPGAAAWVESTRTSQNARRRAACARRAPVCCQRVDARADQREQACKSGMREGSAHKDELRRPLALEGDDCGFSLLDVRLLRKAVSIGASEIRLLLLGGQPLSLGGAEETRKLRPPTISSSVKHDSLSLSRIRSPMGQMSLFAPGTRVATCESPAHLATTSPVLSSSS